MGMQPSLRQTPPRARSSQRATFSPDLPARSAASRTVLDGSTSLEELARVVDLTDRM